MIWMDLHLSYSIKARNFRKKYERKNGHSRYEEENLKYAATMKVNEQVLIIRAQEAGKNMIFCSTPLFLAS